MMNQIHGQVDLMEYFKSGGSGEAETTAGAFASASFEFAMRRGLSLYSEKVPVFSARMGFPGASPTAMELVAELHKAFQEYSLATATDWGQQLDAVYQAPVLLFWQPAVLLEPDAPVVFDVPEEVVRRYSAEVKCADEAPPSLILSAAEWDVFATEESDGGR